MEQFIANAMTVVGGVIVLLVIGAVAGSLITGRQIRDALAAQPAPVIHNTATANAGGAGGAGSGSQVLPVVGLLIAAAMVAWAMTGFKTGAVSDAKSDVPVSQRAAVPTVAPMTAPMTAPAAQPSRFEVAPQPEKTLGDRLLSLVGPVVVVLAVGFVLADVIGIAMLLRRKRSTRGLSPVKAAVPPVAKKSEKKADVPEIPPWTNPFRAVNDARREQRLEEIMPEKVHEVAR